MDETLNLLDCIAHGTSHENFLAQFHGNVQAAVEHLRKFYLTQLAEEGDDPPDADVLRQAMRDAEHTLAKIA